MSRSWGVSGLITWPGMDTAAVLDLQAGLQLIMISVYSYGTRYENSICTLLVESMYDSLYFRV
ncbi:hypothetical protein RSAG8_08161, partial [Rhizoctonia solani AG-8 WAC10335]